MKTFTVEFRVQKAGGTKRVPVVTAGIEIGPGQVVRGSAVCLGNVDGQLWEVPLMRGHLPEVVYPGGRPTVLECHPVPNTFKAGRFFLARPRLERDRVLVRVNTFAGEMGGATGAVVVSSGNAMQVGWGFVFNRSGVRCADALFDIYPSAVLTLVAGGTGGQLHQKYTLANLAGHLTISELGDKEFRPSVRSFPLSEMAHV